MRAWKAISGDEGEYIEVEKEKMGGADRAGWWWWGRRSMCQMYVSV
jgi:hypothetical protein